MSDEKLRLVAEVRDNMSPALRKIKDTLNSVRQSPGMSAATDGMKKLGAETAKFATFGGSASTALNAIGIGGLATAGSLAAVAVQMRALGERSLQMKELARETGVSANWLNVWAHAGEHFGVSADAMQSALNHLTGQMPQFRRHIGSLYNLMAQRWPNLTQKILGEDAEHQVQDIVGLLDKLKNEPQLQKQLASEFFGNGEEMEKLMRDGAQGFWQEFDKQQKLRNPINPELTKQAQAFRDAQIGFNNALENFENKVGPEFLKTMTNIVKTGSALLGDKDAAKDLDSSYYKELDARKKQASDAIRAGEKAQPAGGAADESKATSALKRDLDNGNIAKWLKQVPPAKPDAPAGALQGQDDFNRSIRQSFSKDPFFHRSAFITGGSRDATGLIADGTKAGVLAAFRELMATNDAASAAGGFTNASFETGGSSVSGLHSGVRALRAYHNRNADAPVSVGAPPAGSSAGNLTKLMDEASKKYGIDPRILEGIRAGESGHKSNYDIGDIHNGPAYGPLQLNVGRGRLGDKFQRETHMDLRDPRTIPAQVDWVAKYIRKRLAENPHYNPGREWFGFHGLRNADPRWGDSGYRPDPTRKATGLTPPPTSGASGAHKPVDGHIRADIHVHGGAHKAVVKTRGAIEATLHRWPKMHEFA